MGALAKITAKGQLTLPKQVRDRYGLKPGDRIEFIEEDGKMWIRPRNIRAVDLYGILGPPPSGIQFSDQELDQAIEEAAQEAAIERYVRSFPGKDEE